MRKEPGRSNLIFVRTNRALTKMPVGMTTEAVQIDPGVDPDATRAARRTRITTLFSRPLDRRDKISAANLLKSLEQILGKPKADWNYLLIRSLWSSLDDMLLRVAKSLSSTRKPG